MLIYFLCMSCLILWKTFLSQGLLEARQELRPLLLKSSDRLKDLLFLDIALDSAVRTAIERGYEQLNNAGPEVNSVTMQCSSLIGIFITRHGGWSYFHLSSIMYMNSWLSFLCLQKIMYFITFVLENLALSSDDNEDLIYCLKVKCLLSNRIMIVLIS